jgi:hypothetical protein
MGRFNLQEGQDALQLELKKIGQIVRHGGGVGDGGWAGRPSGITCNCI